MFSWFKRRKIEKSIQEYHNRKQILKEIIETTCRNRRWSQLSKYGRWFTNEEVDQICLDICTPENINMRIGDALVSTVRDKITLAEQNYLQAQVDKCIAEYGI